MENSKKRAKNMRENVIGEMKCLPLAMQEEIEPRFPTLNVVPETHLPHRHFFEQNMRIYPKEIAYRELLLARLDEILVNKK